MCGSTGSRIVPEKYASSQTLRFVSGNRLRVARARDCTSCHQEGQLGRDGSGATHLRVSEEWLSSAILLVDPSPSWNMVVVICVAIFVDGDMNFDVSPRNELSLVLILTVFLVFIL